MKEALDLSFDRLLMMMMSVKIHTATLWIDAVLPGKWVLRTTFRLERKERDAASSETSVSTNEYAVPRPTKH